MAVETVNTQMQLATEYINIYGIMISLNKVNLVKKEENIQNNYKQIRY
jgi:translation initiation factor 2 gamma subunit (eIF-2gamma)